MQRYTNNLEPEIKLTEEEYATLVKLQNRLKLKVSRLKTLKKSAKDLGSHQAIDITKKSRENLFNIKERLRKGELLTHSEQKLLEGEKNKAEDILTLKESRLFAILKAKPYVLHHTSSTSLLSEVLQRDKMLLDAVELERRGVCVRSATPDYCGIENNVFLGFGSRNSTIPLFTRARSNQLTGKREDYTTIQFDFHALQNKGLLRGLWSSGHFFHYQYANSNDISASSYFGETEYYWSYTLLHPLQTELKKPIKYLNFKRKNGTEIKQPLAIDDEIAADKDFILFFAYAFIERLRFIGGKTREYLLDHPEDQHLIDTLIEKLFPVYEFELHLSTKLSIEDSYAQVITPQKRREIAETVCEAAKQGDIAKLKQLKSQGYPLDGYIYNDPYIDDKLPRTGLPLAAALRAKQHETVTWLMANDANRDLFMNLSDILFNPLQEIDLLGAEDSLDLFNVATESGDLSLVDLLLAAGLDVNVFSKVITKHLFELKATFLQAEYKNKNSDAVLMGTIKAVVKHRNFAILDRIVELTYYCKNIEIVKKRIFKDIACVGDEAIFKYFIKKFPQITLEEINFSGDFGLFHYAMRHNNVQIMPFLFQHLSKDERKPDSLKGWAIWCINRGNIEAAEWLLAKAKFKVRDLDKKSRQREHNHSIWISGLSDQIDQPEKFMKTVSWLSQNTKFNIKLDWNMQWELENYSLLQLVLIKKSYDIAKYLIEEHRLVPCQKCVIISINNSNTEFADYLLTKGVRINFQDHEFHQRLHSAIASENVKTVKWLVDKGVNYLSLRIFNTLMKSGTPEIAELLHPIFRFFHEESPVSLFRQAILGGNVAMLNWLAQRYQFNPQEHLFDFLCCCEYGFSHPAETMQWLLDHGVNPNDIDKQKLTNKVENILTFIGRGSSYFSSAFLRLLTMTFKDLVKDIVKEGGAKALIPCIQCCSVDKYGSDIVHILEWMIDCDVNINKPVKSIYTSFKGLQEYGHSITALGAASQKGCWILVTGLLEAGADPQVKYAGNRYAIIEARLYKGKYREEVLHLLASHSKELDNPEAMQEQKNIEVEQVNLELRSTQHIMQVFGITSSTDKPYADVTETVKMLSSQPLVSKQPNMFKQVIKDQKEIESNQKPTKTRSKWGCLSFK